LGSQDRFDFRLVARRGAELSDRGDFSFDDGRQHLPAYVPNDQRFRRPFCNFLFDERVHLSQKRISDARASGDGPIQEFRLAQR
jgi:hypothetical protein